VLSTVVVPTKDRRSEVIESLRSFREAHPDLEYVVCDQSGDAKPYAGARFCGPAEIAAYAEKLVGMGFPKDVLEYALVGGIGGGRNVLLLDTVGEQVLSVDDDTRCSFVAPPGQLPEQFHYGPPLPMYEYFVDRADWQAKYEPAGVSVAEAHDQVLGEVTQDGRTIRVVAAGFIGDSAASCNDTSLVATGPSREQLLSNYEVYRNTREVMQVVQQLTITLQGTWLRTLNFSYDNTSLLPPFPSNCRGENGIFAHLLAGFRTECIAYLPWAITHVPASVREWPLPELSLDGLLLNVISQSGEASMSGRARALMSFSKVPPETVVAFIENYELSTRKVFSDRMEKMLEEYGCGHELWVKDIQEYLQRSKPAVDEARAEYFRNQAALFGRLIEIWPDLWDTARRLRRAGVRVSVAP